MTDNRAATANGVRIISFVLIAVLVERRRAVMDEERARGGSPYVAWYEVADAAGWREPAGVNDRFRELRVIASLGTA